MKLRIALSLLALPLVACGGGGGTPGVGRTAGGERPPYVACDDPNEVRMAPHVCWNPVGSRWHVTTQAPGGALDFDLELMAGGRVRSTDDAAGGPATDEWFVEENFLRIFLANRYVEYRGELTNGTVLVGSVRNVRGDSWMFRAERVHGGSCGEGELALGGGADPICYSAAGSRWTLAGRSTFTVELGAGGLIGHDNPSDTTTGNDTWTQAGNELRLSFDGGAIEYTATLSARPVARNAVERLSGSGRDGGGTFSFTAEPIATYAPPFH